MQQLKKSDSEMVGHARRELEIAGLFAVSKENDYDGFIGKSVLALVKVFDEWTGNSPSKMQAVKSVFDYVIAGDILSPPTNDPEEWEEYNIEGQKGLRNRRNPMFITRDGMKTWFNLRTEQAGICNDIKTGKPLEGVEDPNGQAETATKNKKSSTNASNAGDGRDTKSTTDNPEVTGKAGGTEGSTKVEAGKLDGRMEPKIEKAPRAKKTRSTKPKSGKA